MDKMVSSLKSYLKKTQFRLFAARGFSKYISSLEKSVVYGQFCQEVYGQDLCQLNMVDKEQLEKVIEVLALMPNERLLDLGCGAGKITEYISDVSGAHAVGIDFAKGPIRTANERTAPKSTRLQFKLGNLNKVPFSEQSFDAITSFDTLYFVDDLPQVIRQLKSLLKPTGRMVLMFSSALKSGEAHDLLRPENTKLGLALANAGLKFKTWDFTKNEMAVWTKSLRFAEKLKEKFEIENSLEIYKSRIKEASTWQKKHESQLVARYLYLVKWS